LMELFDAIGDICAASDKKLVLMIDEVDSATNNQVFLDFLAQLRSDYIRRMEQPTFQSVILAGVYDVKNLKRKLRPEDEHKVNSPWNIAADFNVDMSFHPDDIAGMLEEYRRDHNCSFETDFAAQLIYDYTEGYPFLVSRMCQIIDEQLLGKENFETSDKAWGLRGIDEAARQIETEKNTLFESLISKLVNSKELKDIIKRILFNGAEIPYVAMNPAIEQATMFGFIREKDGKAVVANRIFETVLYNLLLTAPEEQKHEIWKAGEIAKPTFIKNGQLDVDLILEHFVATFDDLYGDRDQKFVEEDGRRYFLLYLKPIINGTGNYYIESRTRNNERTDIIIDYLGRQYIIELKIWRGNSYNTRGEQQLTEYLDFYHLNKGWMLSFCFNKNKKIGIKTVSVVGRTLVEAVV
ncbi:MAG: 9-O-acetyl-N-acetylneuraminate esterase, partial [Oribacterium sp.]|nr:9-O-acetyl-N-acetylneuraminate esterase [Oribacterium sp.]